MVMTSALTMFVLMQARVDQIAERVAAASVVDCAIVGRPCFDTIRVSKGPDNALSYGDGRIVLYSRFVMLAQSDDEIAFIIGHEIAHRMDDIKAKKADRELQADRLGARWASRAGYDPRLALAFLRRHGSVFLTGYPDTNRRMRAINEGMVSDNLGQERLIEPFKWFLKIPTVGTRQMTGPRPAFLFLAHANRDL